MTLDPMEARERESGLSLCCPNKAIQETTRTALLESPHAGQDRALAFAAKFMVEQDQDMDDTSPP